MLTSPHCILLQVKIMKDFDPTGKRGPSTPLPDVVKVIEPKVRLIVVWNAWTVLGPGRRQGGGAGEQSNNRFGGNNSGARLTGDNNSGAAGAMLEHWMWMQQAVKQPGTADGS